MQIIIDTQEVDQYENEIDQILSVLGAFGALVTDISTFFDFTIDPMYGEDEDEIQQIRDNNATVMEMVSELCGCRIEENDLLIHAAKMLRGNITVR